MEKLKELPFVDLYGRGIKPINDKYEVLKNAKYAIAYENFQNDYYWTEKIMDCYLSYTMPIYYGCHNIQDYFPKDSFIHLDPKDKHIDLFLKEIVKSKKWEQNIDVITKARELVLNKYQLFPFLYFIITELEAIKGKSISSQKELINIKGQDAYFDNYPLWVKLEKEFFKWKNRINNKLSF